MEKLKIPILSFIVTFSMLVQAQAKQVKYVLTDTPEIRNNKVEQTITTDTLPPSDIIDFEKYFSNLPVEDKSRILCQLPERSNTEG